jgi:hypothetical protein
VEQSALCVDYSDNYGSLRGLVSDSFLHAGVVGDTIVGINALSSVLCVEPQIHVDTIPISLHGRPDFDFYGRSTPERFLLSTPLLDVHAATVGCGH